jgi:hypothetical protein
VQLLGSWLDPIPCPERAPRKQCVGLNLYGPTLRGKRSWPIIVDPNETVLPSDRWVVAIATSKDDRSPTHLQHAKLPGPTGHVRERVLLGHEAADTLWLPAGHQMLSVLHLIAHRHRVRAPRPSPGGGPRVIAGGESRPAVVPSTFAKGHAAVALCQARLDQIGPVAVSGQLPKRSVRRRWGWSPLSTEARLLRRAKRPISMNDYVKGAAAARSFKKVLEIAVPEPS